MKKNGRRIFVAALALFALAALAFLAFSPRSLGFPAGAILLFAALGFGFFAGRFFFGDRRAAAPAFASQGRLDVRSIVKAVLPDAEFSSLVYHYSAVITHCDVGKLFNIPIPLTKKSAIYTIDGTIKLGFDAREIEARDDGYNITLVMPKIKILSNITHPKTFSLYDERTSLFSRYTLKTANTIRESHEEAQRQKVESDSALFAQARRSAEQVFRPLLENIPGIKGR
ncbi:MAG: DUF4230 domain-containing protein, partial [Treponema sp.]|nr:DUF4230 domain-containing protein [Treponema sp.]